MTFTRNFGKFVFTIRCGGLLNKDAFPPLGATASQPFSANIWKILCRLHYLHSTRLASNRWSRSALILCAYYGGRFRCNSGSAFPEACRRCVLDRSPLSLSCGIGNFPLTAAPTMPGTAADLLRETLQHLSNASDTLDRLIAFYEKKTARSQPRLRRKIRKLLHSETMPYEKKVRILGNATRLFTLLCRLDDQRNDLQSFQENLELLVDLQRTPPSEISFWRQEFYETIATVYVLDKEFYGE